MWRYKLLIRRYIMLKSILMVIIKDLRIQRLSSYEWEVWKVIEFNLSDICCDHQGFRFLLFATQQHSLHTGTNQTSLAFFNQSVSIVSKEKKKEKKRRNKHFNFVYHRKIKTEKSSSRWCAGNPHLLNEYFTEKLPVVELLVDFLKWIWKWK